MKLVTSTLSMLSAPHVRGSLRALLRVLAAFLVAVAIFSLGFQALMDFEGREHTWWSSVYWTIVTMTTLGFGDITFDTDVGRMYSVLVLLTGSLLILVLLPFTFIQYVYVPWRDAIRRASAPRELPESTHGHLILTGLDAMEEVLIQRARASEVPYVLLVEDPDQALTLSEQGYRVMVGALDDPDTYRGVRADQAAMVVTSHGDTTNTNVAFTLREVTEHGLLLATATSPDSVDILELAGVDRVLQLGRLLGSAFARRILAPRGRSSVVSRFQDVVIAEVAAHETGIVGRTIADLELRDRTGISVVGVWERGRLRSARPDLEIEDHSVLILAGTEEQLREYEEWQHAVLEPEAGEAEPPPSDEETDARQGRDEERAEGEHDDAAGDDGREPAEEDEGAAGDDGREPADEDDVAPRVLILGGGRVGRVVAEELEAVGTRAIIVERLAERMRPPLRYVHGDAADREVLREAGIDEATSVVITTHDDAMNIYLTLYCRRLRPDVQILGRVNLDRNVSTMHRAGADFVLSYASTGATEAWNELRDDSTLLLAEGLVVFRVPMPASLAGRRLGDTDIARATACTVIGVAREGECHTGADRDTTLPEDGELVLIGDEAAEQAFLRRYVNGSRSWLRRLRRRPA
jgi:voltage-gated potassium channel